MKNQPVLTVIHHADPTPCIQTASAASHQVSNDILRICYVPTGGQRVQREARALARRRSRTENGKETQEEDMPAHHPVAGDRTKDMSACCLPEIHDGGMVRTSNRLCQGSGTMSAIRSGMLAFSGVRVVTP